METTMAIAVLGILAQAVDTAAAVSMADWLQIASSGGFAGLAWYLVAYQLPKIQERFDEHLTASRDAFESQLERQRLAHQAVITEVLNRHDRQVDRLMKRWENTP